MNYLQDNQLTEINGGISTAIWGSIIVGVVFLASVIYGYINPDKCNS